MTAKAKTLKGIDARCSVCSRTLPLTTRGVFRKACGEHPEAKVRWRASVSAPRVGGRPGQRSTKTLGSEAEAQAWLAVKRTELLTTGAIAKPSDLPLSQAVSRWVESRASELAPNTLAAYRRVVPHVESHPTGTIPVSTLTREHVRAMYGAWLTEAQPKSVKQWASVVAGCLTELHSDGLIPRNPSHRALVVAKDIDLEPEVKSWSWEDRERFLSSIDDHPLEALFRLLAWSGVRRGEALALRWSDIDLDDLSFTVERNLVSANRHGDVVVGRTKTGRSRTAYFEETTAASLLALRSLQRRQRFGVLDWFDGEGGDFVFTRANGVPLSPGSVSVRFSRFTDDLDLPRIGVHGLRHSVVSLGADEGVSVENLSVFAGHSSTNTTSTTYVHRGDDAGRVVVDVLKRRASGD